MNYKEINESWQRYLTEQDRPQINTVGDLRKALKTLASKGKGKGFKAFIKDFGGGFMADLFPGGSTIKTAFDAYKAIYSADDKAQTGTAVDHLNVDDKVSAIVDDPIEVAFLKWLGTQIDGANDDQPIQDFNVNKLLAQFIKAGGADLPRASDKTKPTVGDFAE